MMKKILSPVWEMAATYRQRGMEIKPILNETDFSQKGVPGGSSPSLWWPGRVRWP